MNILIINPIMYTSETKTIKRAMSITDTMMYDLCLAFLANGHEVTLYAAEPYRPIDKEQYPFKVIWGSCSLKSLCMPHCLPFMSSLPKYIKANSDNIDLIISSEVFSLNSLSAAFTANKKLIIWHELAKHNSMLKKIPSKIWYNIIARLFMRNTCVVARSEEAREFISKYCKQTKECIIDHGVNLEKFKVMTLKEEYFVVCSQLIERKRIDGIIRSFNDYLSRHKHYKLYIIGDGPLRYDLEELSERLGINKNVIFTGKMSHKEMIPYLSKAKALLINTEKDNSMISIVESIAVGTPVITTDIPLNSSYIKKYSLGIVGNWGAEDLEKIVDNSEYYVSNCLDYRERLSTTMKARQFTDIIKGNS